MIYKGGKKRELQPVKITLLKEIAESGGTM